MVNISFASVGQFLGVDNDNIDGLSNPTSLQFGPDGKLYVSEQGGRISRFEIDFDEATGQYSAVTHEVLNLANGFGVVQSMRNRNDDGSTAPNFQANKRQVTGIVVAGTAENPVLYVSSSDPRIATNNDSNLDTNSGVITRVTWTDTGWETVDIIRGLPRSEENHANNGLVLSPDGTKLYVAVGGNTNNGAPSTYFANTGEYALSGTILEIDLVALNALPIRTDPLGGRVSINNNNVFTDLPRQYIYDLPTLDDPNTPNITDGVGEDALGMDEAGPWGGRDGLNMAILPSDAPLRIYADGFRNPYDLVITQSGQVFTIDNGSNGGIGGNPLDANGVPTDQSGLEATNAINNGGIGAPEPLFLVEPGGYYGHPAPARANQDLAWTAYNNTGGPDTNLLVSQVNNLSDLVPQAIKDAGTIAPGFIIDPSKFTGDPARLLQSGIRVPYTSPLSPTLVNIGSSSNGLMEYTGTAFGGRLQGGLVVAQFNNTITFLNVNNNGTAVEPLVTGLGPDGILGTADDVIDADGVFTLASGLATPLDVTMGPNGTIWVAEIGGDFIKVFAPSDVVVGIPTDSDNDGILNAVDPFMQDASNGTAVTLLPGQTLLWDFDANQDGNRPGSVGFATGLTGVMINGTTNFAEFFVAPSPLPGQVVNLDNMKFATAAGGGTTIVEYVSNGDATGTANNGEYLFHTGLQISPTLDTFNIKWTIVNPLLTEPDQKIGGYIGTGDQSNFLKVVATANTQGEIQILLENNNVVLQNIFLQANDLFSVPPDQDIFIELEVDPSEGTATPTITYTTGTGTNVVTGPAINLGGTNVLSAILGDYTVQGQSMGLAVGLYSSNVNATPATVVPGPDGVLGTADDEVINSFQAIFKDLEITGGEAASSVLYRVNAGGPEIIAIDGGPNWVNDAPFLLTSGSFTGSFPAVNPGATVAATTPGTIFDTERSDPPAGANLQYGFAVDPGEYEVRLFLGNGFGGTNDPGERVFDVAIEGQVLPNLDNIDLAARFGHLVGGMISNTVVVTDGLLNLQFLHQGANNPLVNGIEIIRTGNLDLPAVSIVGGPYTVGEGGGLVQVSILADETIPNYDTVNVTFQIVPGTAIPLADYVYNSPTASFNATTGVYTDTVQIAGSSSDVTFLVDILQDTFGENSEAFTVNLTGVSPNAQLGATTSTTVTITDDDFVDNVVLAINSGGPALTQAGINFVADTGFLNGGAFADGSGLDPNQPVFDGTIYETERFQGSTAPLNYSIPVAPGDYTVELHFAEFFFTNPGQRVFDVLVEGQLVLDDLDILAETGNTNLPFIFTVPNSISPDDFGAANAIDISFQGSVNNAKVSGIVIRSAADPTPIEVSIAQTTDAAEPNTPGLFTVSLTESAATNTVVTYSIGGTATAGADYTALSGSVTILAGQTSATIPVSVLDDTLVEGNETVVVTLTGANNGVVLGATQATVTIADNDQPAPTSFTVEAESITNVMGYRIENNLNASGGSMRSLVGGANGETGTASFTFNGITGAYNIYLGTFDENDGVATLQVAKGSSLIGSVVLDQQLGGNGISAGTKVERLVTTAGATTLTSGDTITVTGFENGGEHARFDFIRFEAASAPVNTVSVAATQNAGEPSSNGLFTVSLAQAVGTNTVVNYSVGGTATAGADYTPLSGSVTILAGQTSATIPVSVLDDTLVEGNESLIATLTGVSGSTGVALGAVVSATMTIADNDVALEPITFEAENANAQVNYRIENLTPASGGQVLSFVGGATGETGSATFNFGPDLLAGTYNIILGTFDENDGVASFTVALNDFETQTTSQIGSLVLDANLGSAAANLQTKFSTTVATGISLSTGDSLTVTGFENGAEHARLDFLQLVPTI